MPLGPLPRRGQGSASIVQLTVDLVVQAGLSMRGAVASSAFKSFPTQPAKALS